MNNGQRKTALITGGAGGLGLALTRHLAQQGWLVFAADCIPEALAALADTANVKTLTMDVTDNSSIEKALNQIQQHTQHLDAVINFAGILRVGAMIEMDEATLRQVLDVNLLGTYRVNKLFFPMLQNASPQPGRIVNVSSETGWHTPSPFNGAYAMSKYGIEAYSASLRRELSIFNIPVIKVQPGPFKTNMVSSTVNGFYAAAEQSNFYKKHLKKFGDLVDEANQKAANPEHLASIIYKAITVKNPKANYSVKADMARSFMELLPMRLADWIYKKIMQV